MDGMCLGKNQIFGGKALGSPYKMGVVDGLAKHLPQFSDITGPVVSREHFTDFVVEGNRSDVQTAGHLIKKVFGEKQEIGPFPQRRKLNLHFADPVIKVGAKTVFPNLPGQILVRGGDDADVDGDGPIGADPGNLLFLQDPQEYRLGIERHFADFVQKKRSPVCRFEFPPVSSISGAGKSAFLVTEQFRLQKRFRNGTTVYDDEGAFSTASLVDLPGDKIFPGAGFSPKKDGGIGTGHMHGQFEDFLEFGAGGDPFFKRYLYRFIHGYGS